MRHAAFDRAVHWLSAACVLALLGTAFLPILGLQFGWVTIHWVTGLALMALVLAHVVRALVWQEFRTIWFDRRDFADAAAIVRSTFRLGVAPGNPGKYSFAQKLVHLCFALVIFAALGTGGLMLVKIDTPWWDRNPYWLSDAVWGVVYVVHDLAALSLITMVMVHVYFALRPEKWQFTRSMLRGWITRREYADQHDPSRWQVEE